MTEVPPRQGARPTLPPDPDRTRYTAGKDTKLGRPLKLTSTITIADADGNLTRRTIHDATVDLVRRTGLPAITCADNIAGCGRVAKDWLRDARKLADKPPTYPTRYQQVVLAFLYATQQAHAQWVAERQQLVSQLAHGGVVTSRITEEIDPVRKDPSGRPMVLKQTVVRDVSGPNLAALTLELKYLARDSDGKRIFADRVEVTGADGAPLMGDDEREKRARALLAEVDAYGMGLVDGQTVERELGVETQAGADPEG